jgi:hypothetical protein
MSAYVVINNFFSKVYLAVRPASFSFAVRVSSERWLLCMVAILSNIIIKKLVICALGISV